MESLKNEVGESEYVWIDESGQERSKWLFKGQNKNQAGCGIAIPLSWKTLKLTKILAY